MEAHVLTINMRRYLVGQPRTRRARKASRYFKERIAHYTKMQVENVKIDSDLNSMIIKYYSKYMKPIKASVRISDGVAKVVEFGKAEMQSKAKEGVKKNKLSSIKTKVGMKGNLKGASTRKTNNNPTEIMDKKAPKEAQIPRERANGGSKT